MNDLIVTEINKVLSREHLNLLANKKVRTNGGEYASPCPRCKALHGNGGEDRFRVHPERPVWSAAASEEERFLPCFVCRQCTRPGNESKPWSGDLVTFVQWAYDLDYPSALAYLGLGDVDPNRKGVMLLKPALSVTGAPAETWQKRALDFILVAEQTLWDTTGAKELKYLRKRRKLTDETIKAAHLGAMPLTLYEEASAWGLPGKKVKLCKGIVIPEYHLIERDGLKYREIWAISIRRDMDELIDEEAESGKPSNKYHQVAGSVPGLYGYDQIKKDLPLVVVEGQIDQLTVLQEGCGEFSAVATCGTGGARATAWIARIATAEQVIFALDPDAAGRKAYDFWESVVEEERRILWQPEEGDLNEMLRKGGNVYRFLCRGRDALKRMQEIARSTRSRSKPVTEVNTPLVISEPFLPLSDADTAYKLEVRDTPCYRCGDVCDVVTMQVMEDATSPEGFVFLCADCYTTVTQEPTTDMSVGNTVVNLVDTPLVVSEALTSLSEACTADERKRCSACYTEEDVIYEGGTYDDSRPRYWCKTHFAAADLMEWGVQYKWRPFEYPAEQGMVRTDVWVDVKAGKMVGGQENYVTFTREHSAAEVWVAMWWCRILVKGDEKLYWKQRRKLEAAAKVAEVVEEQTLCSRHPGGCNRQWNVPMRLSYAKKKDKHGKETNLYLHPEEQGREHVFAGHPLHWCAECRHQCVMVLEFGDLLDFPAFRVGTVRIEQGADAWIHVVTHSSSYEVTQAFDELRHAHGQAWDIIAETLPIA